MTFASTSFTPTSGEQNESLHSADGAGNHMSSRRRLGNLQETGQVDQEPKDTRNKSGKQEGMEGCKAIGRETVRDFGALSTEHNQGRNSSERKDIVVVDEIKGRVVDGAERLFDDDRVEGSGDGGDDTENDAGVGDVDLGGDTSVEAAEDGKAGDQDQF